MQHFNKGYTEINNEATRDSLSQGYSTDDVDDSQQQQQCQLSLELSQTKDESLVEKSQVKKQHFGRNRVFSFKKIDNQPRFTFGPHFPLFACTWKAFITADFFLIRLVWTNAEDQFWPLLTLFICTAHVISYLITAIINPGIAHSKDEQSLFLSKNRKNPEFCSVCEVAKDSKTYHCDSCEVCVRDFDHHCPWTGKCIARGNIKPFNVFLALTFGFMAYAVVVTVVVLMPPPSQHMRYQAQPEKST